jgi:hypothetical protein
MLKNYKFADNDIEGVLIGEHNIIAETVEVLIKKETEAVLIHKSDVIEMAKHFGINICGEGAGV